MKQDSIRRILEATLPTIDPEYRGDANETSAMARQLEFFYSQLYSVEYTENMGRKIVPLDMSVPTGARAHTYVQTDERGEAELVESYAGDFPLVDEFGKEYPFKISGYASGFFVSIQDIRSAQMLGRDIESRKADLARRAIERKLDALLCTGDTKTGSTGLANNANVSSLVGAGGGGTDIGGSWANATSDQIQEDVEIFQKKIFDDTKGIHGNPENGTKLTLVLPPTAYSTIASRRLDNFHNMSVLQYLRANSPFIGEITTWARLAGIGASSSDRAVLFERNINVAAGVIPQDVEILPMQPKAFGWQVPMHMRFGGVIMRYPKGVLYIDGI